jgi:hypothetical protein
MLLPSLAVLTCAAYAFASGRRGEEADALGPNSRR